MGLLAAASGLAGLALAAIWWFTFLVLVLGCPGGLPFNLTLAVPDMLFGWKGAPDAELIGFLQFNWVRLF